MLFFLDNNLSPALAGALNALCKDEADVFHLRRMFPEDISDGEWIRNLEQREDDWIIVTSDRLQKSEGERELVRRSNMIWFFLLHGWSDQTHWVKSWKLIKAWPDIMKEARRAGSNSSFSVQVNGRIHLL